MIVSELLWIWMSHKSLCFRKMRKSLFIAWYNSNNNSFRLIMIESFWEVWHGGEECRANRKYKKKEWYFASRPVVSYHDLQLIQCFRQIWTRRLEVNRALLMWRITMVWMISFLVIGLHGGIKLINSGWQRVNQRPLWYFSFSCCTSITRCLINLWKIIHFQLFPDMKKCQLFGPEKQDHLRMNIEYSTVSNNHLRSIDLFRS